MATGDAAAAAGLAVFASTQDIRLGYDNDNVRGDELATHITSGTHPASAITSGVLDLARIPTLDTARIPSLDASKITSGTLADARIPNLSATKITSGTITRPVSTTTVTTSGQITATGGDIVTNASLIAAANLRADGVYSLGLGTWQSVVTNASGYLGFASSTKRVKQDIKKADITAAQGLALVATSFRYKKDVEDLGEDAQPTIGLIAEDLHDAGLTQFVIYDAKGKPLGIHYERAWIALIPVIQDIDTRLKKLEGN
jgi:hypothetical protein